METKLLTLSMKGHDFMLKNTQEQCWIIIRQYIRNAEGREDRKKYLYVIYLFLFRLSDCNLGNVRNLIVFIYV